MGSERGILTVGRSYFKGSAFVGIHRVPDCACCLRASSFRHAGFVHAFMNAFAQSQIGGIATKCTVVKHMDNDTETEEQRERACEAAPP